MSNEENKQSDIESIHLVKVGREYREWRGKSFQKRWHLCDEGASYVKTCLRSTLGSMMD